MNLDRALWPEGLVAGLATLAVAWPLTELLRDNEWVGTAMLMIALVMMTLLSLMPGRVMHEVFFAG